MAPENIIYSTVEVVKKKQVVYRHLQTEGCFTSYILFSLSDSQQIHKLQLVSEYTRKIANAG